MIHQILDVNDAMLFKNSHLSVSNLYIDDCLATLSGQAQHFVSLCGLVDVCG